MLHFSFPIFTWCMRWFIIDSDFHRTYTSFSNRTRKLLESISIWKSRARNGQDLPRVFDVTTKQAMVDLTEGVGFMPFVGGSLIMILFVVVPILSMAYKNQNTILTIFKQDGYATWGFSSVFSSSMIFEVWPNKPWSYLKCQLFDGFAFVVVASSLTLINDEVVGVKMFVWYQVPWRVWKCCVKNLTLPYYPDLWI